MSDIQRLIELLKSDNPKKRYDACEELGMSRPPIPQDAIDALQFATGDSNPDVVDAAQRALALPTSWGNEKEQGDGQEQTLTSTVKYGRLEKTPTILAVLGIGTLVGIFFGFLPILMVLMFMGVGEGIATAQQSTATLKLLLVTVVLSIVGAGIGAKAAKSPKEKRIGLWVGAILCLWIPIVCLAIALFI